MKHKNTFLIIVIILLIAGCKKNYSLTENQHILFQYEFITYSPEYLHEGFYVDNAGEIMHYRDPESWNYLTNDYSITGKQLAENLSRCIASDVKTDKDDLIKFSSYIDNIASSRITARKETGSGTGTGKFICYKYDEQNRIYRGTIIKMEGDVTCENLNFYSKKVTLWLTDLNKRITPD